MSSAQISERSCNDERCDFARRTIHKAQIPNPHRTKQLIPVANRPNSQYVVENLRNSGISSIAIVLRDTYPEKVKEHCAL